METETDYAMAFSFCDGIGPMRYRALLERFVTAKKAYQSSEQELVSVLGKIVTGNFLQFRRQYSFQDKKNIIKHKKITVICQSDSRFPKKVREISDCPICIYIRGSIDAMSCPNPIAIVGTRKPTTYGISIAQIFSSALAEAGFSIISGLALGIDGEAHQACLASKGVTVAVLGCGVDICYPTSHWQLYEAIIESGGAIISEFPPGKGVGKGQFVARNRIIAGLSAGVLVVEGLKDSGSLTTAAHAARYGRDVFAPPCPITSPYSEAPNLLIQQGAVMVTSPQDMLAYYGIKIGIRAQNRAMNRESLNPQETITIGYIKSGINEADEISRSSNIPIDQIGSVLSLLEIKGYIKRNREERYETIYGS